MYAFNKQFLGRLPLLVFLDSFLKRALCFAMKQFYKFLQSTKALDSIFKIANLTCLSHTLIKMQIKFMRY